MAPGVTGNLAETMPPRAQMWYPVSIPAGSRVAARARAGTTDATDRTFDLILYALVN